MDPGDVRGTRDRLMKRYCECRSMSEKWDNKSMSLVLAIWPIVGLVNTV